MLAVFASCSAPEAARIGLVMNAPLAGLADAKAVSLSVFDASKGTCEAETGHVPIIPSKESGTQTFALENTGCPAGVAWCKQIELDRDGSTKIFAVVARNEGGVVAEGCTAVAIDQDPLEVSIKVHLTVKEKCCGDGTLQPGEQCEAPVVTDQCPGITATDLCDATCQSLPFALAINSDEFPTLTEGGKGKTDLAMAFAEGDAQLSGGLRTAYTSTSTDATGKADVNIRMLREDLTAIDYPFPFSHQFRLPLHCDVTGGPGTAREQRSPAIAAVTPSRTAIVFESNEAAGTLYEIYLSPQSPQGCALTYPFKVSVKTPPGSEHAQRPDVAAGPDGRALVVWTRAGTVKGRIWEPPPPPPPPPPAGMENGTVYPADLETELELTPQALNVTDVHVAGWSGGWVIVYAGKGVGDNDGVFMNTVTKDGVIGDEVRVNAEDKGVQDQPDVAVLRTGERMVVWRSDNDIYFQRYDAKGVAVGDQFDPIHAKDAVLQQRPAVAASEVGAFFVAAWEHGEQEIHARIAGPGESFLPNSVTGQTGAFVATYPGSLGMPRRPAVAIGGYVVIGWHDESMENPGVFVRRFPLP
jgi:hypothetical protein